MPTSPLDTADDNAAAPPRPPLVAALRWLPLVLLIFAIPVAIFLGWRVIFRRANAADDTPGVRQLKAVGVALRRYAADHGGAYPPTLAALELPPKQIVCPTDGEPLVYAAQGKGWTEQQVTNGTILAYEPSSADDNHGSAILFADGSVSWVDAMDLKDELDHGKPPKPPE